MFPTVHNQKFGNMRNCMKYHIGLGAMVSQFRQKVGYSFISLSVQRSNACHVGTSGKVVSIDDMYSHIPLQNRFELSQYEEECIYMHPVQCESPSDYFRHSHGHSRTVPKIHVVPAGQDVQALPNADGQECQEYQQCKAQNGVQFSCVPLSPH